MAATALLRPPNSRRAAARSRSSCCASATACRATRRSRHAAGSIRCCRSIPQAIGKPALIIDALFGAGLNRPVKGDPHEMIEAINANGAPVLAVDLPSGDQRHDGRRDGRRDQRRRDRDVLPPQAGASVAAGTDALRLRVRVADIGIDRAACSTKSGRGRSRTFRRAWQESFPVPRHRRPQICPRPRGRRVRRAGVDRRGAARRRGARYGQGPASSRWRRRATRWRSTLRR